MVDNKLILIFKEYVNNYNINDYKIKLKYEHSIKVMELCIMIGRSLSLSEEDINILTIIGLIHDIGRFEQVSVHDNFDDLKTFDHGNYGVKLLKEGLLRKFIKEDIYDDIILKTIENHNKYQIEDNLDEKTMLFCKIIRDADKLDIFRVFENIEYLLDEEISSNILTAVYNKKTCNKKDVVTKTDRFISNIALIFDLNYSISYKYIYDNDNLFKLCSNIKYDSKTIEKEINNIIKYIKEYINMKLDRRI